MYLKSIEVQGFKSFAHKLTFTFQEGITGIVGPNGSGKSNVADAVRWVLGEQSAKQLRGGNMQDVIFAGTQTRKPQGFASVSITLDNADHALPVDFEEVTVTRRLYRSGESEYIINNSQVRLRDIQEIFYDTGIGKEGYSIIGQGQIDKILSGKPEERRELFDEAAGIVKFKRRKHATLKKLAEEEQNLLRVNDILSELTGQLEPLRRQSETAKQYLEKRDALKENEIRSFLAEENYTGSQMQTLSEKLSVVDGDLAEAKEAFEETRQEYSRIEAESERLETELNEVRERSNTETLARQELTGRSAILKEQIAAIRRSEESGTGRREAIARETAIRREESKRAGSEQTEVRRALDALAKKREEKTAGADAIGQKLAAAEESIARGKEDVIGMLNSRASVKGKVQRYDTMREQMGIRRSEIDGRLLRMREEELSAEKIVEESTARLKQVADEIHTREEASRENEAQTAAVKEEIASCQQKLDEVQNAYHRDKSRHDSLKAMAERYEGYGGAIRKIMEQKDRNPGIRGLVSELIRVPEKYETAIETALGGSIRHIVTDNEATAKYLIASLKRQKAGRATFLPLVSLKRRTFDNPKVLKEEGVIGTAASLVETEDEFEVLRDYLLGRTVVVTDIDHAIALGRKYHHSLYMVTLQGESFSPGGSITGGAFKNAENLLGRNREIDELAKAITQHTKDADALNAQIEALRDKRGMLRTQAATLADETHRFMLALNTAQMTKKQAEEQKRLHAVNRASLEKEREEIRRQMDEVDDASRSITEELKSSEEKEQEINKKTVGLEEEAAALREELQAATRDLEAIRVEEAQRTERLSFLSADLDRITADLARLSEEDESLAKAAAGYAQEIADKEAEIAAANAESETKKTLIGELAEKETALKEARQDLTAQHKDFFDRRDALSERISALDKDSFRLTAQKEKLEEALEALASHLWEEYEMTPSEARALHFEGETDRRAVKRQIAVLREEIRALGPVNVNAIEDYKALLERHTFLSAQHEDLVRSGDTLRGIIAELDRGMRKQFSERFALIQTEFDKAFKELFGGGSGTIELDPDADLLEAGITITAHPPGKKLQNMMQLSGGEKALTAIVLLFAIQNLKPSPFCLLDEIEAALDDNNVLRFANYLHKLTQHTQFIIITHRRGTMTAADRLYGITMQEKGVSTLISVSLIESKLSD